MEPQHLGMFSRERLEKEDADDMYMRTNVFTSMLGFICPIFKPKPGDHQIFQVFKMYKKGNQIRVILSDGYDLEHAVVAPEVHGNIRDYRIERGSIVIIYRHSMHSHIQKKLRLIMIHEMMVLFWGSRMVGLDSLEYGIWPSGGEWIESDWDEENYRRLDPNDINNWEDHEECRTIVPTLTSDALLAMHAVCSAFLQPTLQIVDIRPIGSLGVTPEKYRMILSDGAHVQQSFLGSELNEKAKIGLYVKGSIVKLLNYEWNTISNRRILHVLNMNPCTIGGEIIGVPDPRPILSGPDATNPLTQDDTAHQDWTDDERR